MGIAHALVSDDQQQHSSLAVTLLLAEPQADAEPTRGPPPTRPRPHDPGSGAPPDGAVSETDELLLRRAYAAFNARAVEDALALVHPDVNWANGMDGGRLHGHSALREYWQRQFGLLDPHVEPRHMRREPDGRVAVTVHQVVRDHTGRVISEGTVEHRYTIGGGAIERMDIGSAT